MNTYTEELKKIFKEAEKQKRLLNHNFVEAEHFLLAVLNTSNNLKTILNEYEIYYEDVKQYLTKNKTNNFSDSNIYSLPFKKIIENSSMYLKESSNKLNPTHVFISILEDEENKAITILESLNCPLNEIYIKFKKGLYNKGHLYLNEIGTNLNELAKNNKCERTVGRDKEINRVIEILARKNKNNPILIGEAGVGKTAIVEELAKRITEGKVPLILKDTEIILLSMANLVAGTKYRGEFEEKLGKIIKELENNKNLIIFIDEIHTLVGAGGAEGAIDASNILKPALARNNIRCIGATTLSEYKKFISNDKALDRRFQKVYVEATTKDETLYILKKIKKDYESFHGVKISNEILSLIVDLSDKYIHSRKEPDRSIDVLDEVCAKTSVNFKNNYYLKLNKRKNKLQQMKKNYLKLEDYLTASKIKKEELEIEKLIKKESKKNQTKEVTKEDLKKVLEFKSNSIIMELSNKNYNYKIMKENLKKKIIGQDKNIDSVIDIIKRKELSFKQNKPLSFLFNGPTGVGKTETAKLLSKELKFNLIKLDMSEFNNEMSINKIIGSSQGYIGYDDVNTVFESVKDKPNSLIILDEIDKCSKKVLNLFLNILDEGTLRTSKNEIINFKNTIFILTTNNLNKNENIGFNKTNKIDSNIFNKEFINRIDNIINFNSLTEENIINIIKEKALKFKKELNQFEINNIISKSNYQEFGARRLENLIIKELSKKVIKN